MNQIKCIITLLLALAMLFALAACGGNPGNPNDPPQSGVSKVPTTYPWVFVHGLNGFGDDTGVPVSYWGATGGPLLPALEADGFRCHAPTLSAAGSAWDRACELYAQITGTRVDFGAAHSAQYGHARYGKTYDTPLLPDWGEIDEDGNLRKVNLIAHSFGGATARVLCALLQNGDLEEQGAALAEKTEPSGLFAGGKGDWVFSLTCLAAPHNGVSLLSMLDVNPLLALGANLLTGIDLDSIFDALGISVGAMSVNEFLRAARAEDTAYADLSLKGAQRVNMRTCLAPDTYYFSFPVDGTENNKPTNDMSGPAQISAGLICSFTHPASGIDDSWRANDGLVNTVSATFPSSEPHALFSDSGQDQLKPALWYVMPTFRGDHGSVIGLGRGLEDTARFYREQMRLVDALSLRVTG